MRLLGNEMRARAAAFATEWRDAAYEKGETQSFYNEFFEIPIPCPAPFVNSGYTCCPVARRRCFRLRLRRCCAGAVPAVPDPTTGDPSCPTFAGPSGTTH